MGLTAMGVANAQRASEYDVKYHSSNAPEISSYNRIGISYNNTQLSMGGEMKDELDNFSLNGVGIDYVHGFVLSKTMPMFIETGANVNFNFGNSGEVKQGSDYFKSVVQNFNIQVPVNYVYRFGITDDFSIAPYAGLNFKLHLLLRERAEWKIDGSKGNGDWENFFSKDDMGEDGTFNRFQMGWQIGANFQYSCVSLGVQYGTDFIPFYHFSQNGYKASVNTGNLKLILGYNF